MELFNEEDMELLMKMVQGVDDAERIFYMKDDEFEDLRDKDGYMRFTAKLKEDTKI
jgi:hypothetical protein